MPSEPRPPSAKRAAARSAPQAAKDTARDVTSMLGSQLRRAVELFVQTIDRIDRERGGALLRGVDERALFECAVTVVMRVVVLLAAEERGLLPAVDSADHRRYAPSTLFDELYVAAEERGADALAQRYGAWPRLLTIFRAVHGGATHGPTPLPPHGGALFDPDRFPFLEGRGGAASSSDDGGRPPPIDDLTVLGVLSSLDTTSANGPRANAPRAPRRRSTPPLDVEQIGHLYEGLLDVTVKRATSLRIVLRGAGDIEPAVELEELERRRAKGDEELIRYLVKVTGRSRAALGRALARAAPSAERDRCREAWEAREPLRARIAPYAALLRDPARGRPVVIEAGSVYLATGGGRRSTGTHYTPRSLTEPIVRYALEPLVYEGPSQGWATNEWKLRPPKAIVALRVCDCAMGAGAFLAQACRYLAARVVDAWGEAERAAGARLAITHDGELRAESSAQPPSAQGREERLVIARRLVAERCLYGVDKDPLAVEVAKVSLWLLTAKEGQPFTFLDGAMKVGDSLLGLTDVAQIERLHLDLTRAPPAGLDGVRSAVKRAFALRGASRAPDSGGASRLDEAESATGDLRLIADAIVGAALATSMRGDRALDGALRALIEPVQRLVSAPPDEALKPRLELAARARALLEEARAPGDAAPRPFHWAIEFPEVFSGPERGFSALVGNPPFLGGKRITTALGEKYAFALRHFTTSRKGAGDLAARFLLRAFELAAAPGAVGLLLTNSINEGDTREIGLAEVRSRGGHIYRASTDQPWPGGAAITISIVFVAKGRWSGAVTLDERPVAHISAYLAEGSTSGDPRRLQANAGVASIGTYVNGAGFVVDERTRAAFVREDAKNADVLSRYLTSRDINQRPTSEPSRFVINFGDMDRAQAARYRAPFRRVVERVKPARDALTRQVHEPCFWKHWDRRGEFYKRLRQLDRALVLGRVSTYHAATFMKTDWIAFDGVVVFLWSDFASFALLQSSIHELWCDRFRTSLREDPRYSVSDCFMTYPAPRRAAMAPACEEAGKAYFEARARQMALRSQGLTAIYHALHDSAERSPPIEALRERGRELDAAVARAYGWADVDLGHGFHPTKRGLRYTISEPARRVILGRLLDLNLERYAEEAAQGLHRAGPAPSLLSSPI